MKKFIVLLLVLCPTFASALTIDVEPLSSEDAIIISLLMELSALEEASTVLYAENCVLKFANECHKIENEELQSKFNKLKCEMDLLPQREILTLVYHELSKTPLHQSETFAQDIQLGSSKFYAYTKTSSDSGRTFLYVSEGKKSLFKGKPIGELIAQNGEMELVPHITRTNMFKALGCGQSGKSKAAPEERIY